MILYVSIISIISFIHFASWALWYAARFVHVIALKVLVLRDEIEFLFIRNFTFLRFSDLIYLLLCSLLTTFEHCPFKIVGLSSVFLGFLLLYCVICERCFMMTLLRCKSMECTSNDNSPCSQNLFNIRSFTPNHT